MADCSQEAIGKRIRKLKGKLTQEQLADKIGYSRQQVSKWVIGKQIPSADQLFALSEFFGVSTDYLISGVDSSNRLVHAELGLSDEAISFLKCCDIANPEYYGKFFDDEHEYSSENVDVRESCLPSEFLTTLNWLLSHKTGRNMLALVFKFLFTDSSETWSYSKFGGFRENDDVYFKNVENDTMIPVNLSQLFYSFIPMINGLLYRMRDEIRNEVREK